MSWVDSVIEQMKSPIEVDVSHLKMKDGDGNIVQTIEVLPLSANEYQTLKMHPYMREAKGLDDKTERLGLIVTYEMIRKCDDSMNFNKFKQLPLHLLNDLSTAILAATRGSDGDADPLSE